MDHIPVTDLERRILVLLHEAPTLTGSKLAEYLDIGRGTVKEYLRRLKAKRVLMREGSTRTGRLLRSILQRPFLSKLEVAK